MGSVEFGVHIYRHRKSMVRCGLCSNTPNILENSKLMDGPVSNAPIARVTLPKSVSASVKYKMRTISNMHRLRRDGRADGNPFED
jgi:hypothetical protein